MLAKVCDVMLVPFNDGPSTTGVFLYNSSGILRMALWVVALFVV